MISTSTYQTLFETYQDSRFLKKLEDYSLWTIPSLFPEVFEHGSTGNMEIQHDYQSMGAMLVNNLAPKLAKLLFPFKQPFFNIQVSPAMREAFGLRDDDNTWRNTLVNLEVSSCNRLFLNGGYAGLLEALKLCIVTGNALVIRQDSKTIVYSLRNYSLIRDNSGVVLDLIIKESKAWGTLPDALRAEINRTDRKDTDSIDLYTRVRRVLRDKVVGYEVTQQVDGKDVGVLDVYPENLCPYVPAVWSLRAGDSYGRGLVEELAGDFAKYSDVSKALAQYELETLRLVNLVKPGSTTDVDALEDAVTGQSVQGNPADIQPFEGGEFAKIRQVLDDLTVIESRLARAFMYSGNTRQGERVTAREVEINANEADEALGGAVSTLSAYMHTKLAHLLLHETEPEFIVAMIAGEFTLDITAGVPALGRSADVQNLIQATQIVAAVIPALQGISQRPDPERILDTVLRSFNVDTQPLFRTEEELKALQEANAQAVAQANSLSNVQAIGEL